MKKEEETKKENTSIKDIVFLDLFAIVGAIFKGGLLEAFGTICWIISIVFLIKRRKVLLKKQKWLGWGLVVLWAIINGVVKGV